MIVSGTAVINSSDQKKTMSTLKEAVTKYLTN